ncbi:MAG TPA: FAD-binding and (Fe-S)-binding domain-containing protein [Bacteroidales bacterium]|nr:FAD-binding and (Fe-S)-binding domain-containing protein [Bacteroidales bacterium]
MLNGRYLELYNSINKVIDKKRIFHDTLHTLAYGTDASFYRLIPKIVIRAQNEDEAIVVIRECNRLNLPVTFRAAGTSLSGQAVTDSVLLLAGTEWKKYRIEDEGRYIWLQPGLTGGKVNRLLAKHGRKIGPDPASINAAMIGGIAANNASGMCCGTAENSYKTIAGIRVLLADGTVLDTTDRNSREQFRSTHNSMLSAIEKLGEKVRSDKELASRIRHKYKMKNTTGYSLNALVDYSDPFDIIEHLMIGSEGTLGFISGLTYRTVEEKPCRASSLIIFPDIRTACMAVSLLKSGPVQAVELIDRQGLKSVEDEAGVPEYLKTLNNTASALLIETASGDKASLAENINNIRNTLSDIPTVKGISFTDLPSEYELLWKIRKGLFPSVGAMRKAGTTVIIEDVAFPVPRLAEATLDLQDILKKYNYNEAVIFGHALEGNLHFVFTQDFSNESEIERYKNMLSEVSGLVVEKYDGSLKAEHGTGRNMAPFVELEWGKDAYQLMKDIKMIFDPKGIFNPGVILNDDKDIHLKNLKPLPPADELIDKCTECGFCESACVAADLTLSPRQRITVYREIRSLIATGSEPHIAAELVRSFSYSGDATCATDGLCAISCPVKIDTGKLIKNLRAENIGSHDKIAGWIANNMNTVTASLRAGLNIVAFFQRILGSAVLGALAGGIRKVSFNTIPAWNKYMPAGSKKIKPVTVTAENRNKKVVYFPSCINRSMGVSAEHRQEKQLSEVLMGLCSRAGYEVIFPDNLDNLCCGMAFLSKGYRKAGTKKSVELETALLKASNNGEYPVLCDMSPCLFTMKENMKSGLRLYEPVEFILDFLMANLSVTPVDETVTVFPVCSMKKMGLEGKLAELANKCAKEVIVADTNCCGFAGDRGFTYPELNRHGLRNLKTQIPESVTHGYSTSRTCEIGMSNNTGISFKSIIYLAELATREKQLPLVPEATEC